MRKNTHSCSDSISLWHPTPTPAPAALGVFSEDQTLLLCRWRNLPVLARQGVKGSLALALCKSPLLSFTQPFFSSSLQLLTPSLTAWGLPPARSSLRDFLFAVNPWCKNTGHVCTFDGSSLLNLPRHTPRLQDACLARWLRFKEQPLLGPQCAPGFLLL